LKKINFKKVRIENFCGYTDKFEFEFDNNKISLITGPNGIGKSTIFSAIPFALYGMTQTGQRPDDVLNNKVGKNCRVDCLFSIDDKKYMVTRTVKYSRLGSSAYLYEDGDTQPIAKGYREVTNMIENILIPKDLFMNTVLFGQKIKTFFTDLPDSKQKEIFRKILQLDNYVDYQKNASSFINDLNDDLSENQNKIGNLKSKIDLIENNNIVDLQEQISIKIKSQKNNIWEKELKEKELAQIKDDLEKLKENELMLEYDNLNNQVQSIKNEQDNLKNLYDSKINELKNEFDLKVSKQKESILEQENIKLQIKNKTIEDLNKNVYDSIAKIQEHLEDLRKQYSNEKEKIIDKNNEEIKNIKENYNEKINKNTNDIDNINNKINDIKVKISKISTVIDFSNIKIKGYNNAIENHQSICPTCLQKWDDVSHIQKLIDEESKIVVEKSEILNNLTNEQQQLLEKKLEIQENISKLNDELNQVLNSNKEKFDLEIEDFNNIFKEKAQSYKNDISELENNLEKQKNELENNYIKSIDELNKNLVIFKNDIEQQYNKKYEKLNQDFEKDKIVLSEKLESLQNNLIEIKHSLAKIESVKHNITNLEKSIIGIDQNIIEISNNLKDYNEQIKKNKDLITDLEKEIQDIEKNITKIKDKIKICNFWKVAFSSSGIPSMLIDESIPFMNKKISEYLEIMSNGRYIVTFDTLKETKSGEFRDKISIHVYDSMTHSNSRINLSGGQTRLIDIATILTLSDLQEDIHKFSINILLFDEIFDALDDQNINNVASLLRRILNDDKSINIITHRHIDQVEAENIYNFGS
jgi:DNA repair exonuclease SbcCD ATPase subunit